jgi:hypothetical protein
MEMTLRGDLLMYNQNAQQQANFQATDMYNWRLNRHATEKREENVNRDLLRRQHTN